MGEIITDNPLVSILVLVFNHENYIADALNGILMQKVNFEYEIVLGEDCSTDKSREIILKYAKIYPDKFKLLLHERNIGAIANQMAALSVSSGKFIAFCEGDDYWTDPLKLQKQVDFLEENPEYSGAAHQSLMAYAENTNQKSELFREHNITDIEINHLLNGRLFHTASFILRSEIIKNNPIPTNITSFDRALFLLTATFGKIHYSKEVMCCYRKHSGGMSSWVTTEMLEKDLNIVPWISQLNPRFPNHQYYQFLHLVALGYPPFLSLSKVFKHSILFIYHSLYTNPNKFQEIKTFVLHRLPLFLSKTNPTGSFSKIILSIGKLFGLLPGIVKKWFSAL